MLVRNITIALLTLSTVLTRAAHNPSPTSAPSTSSNFKVIYESPSSVCYAENRAYLCTPPFTNIAEGVPVVATSTCGQNGRPEKICQNSAGDPQKHTLCEICDARKMATNRGSERLTDRHITSNQTCWISGRVPPGGSVNLTLSLGKRFEIFYISLQPCGPLPDSIALYKSSDFGRTWKPWQYFSTDCYRAFGLPTSNEHSAQISSANIQEVLCVALKSPSKYTSQRGQVSNVIAFSTTIGRSNLQSWSPALIDWMTMTDLQISLTRFPSRKRNSSREGEHDSGEVNAVLNRRGRSSGQRRVLQKAPIFRLGSGTGNPGRHFQRENERMQSDGDNFNSTSRWHHEIKEEQVIDKESEGDTVHFAFSDITVGGRCKCNGHSNRCIRDRIVKKNASGEEVITWGPLRCDCQHNTVGVDCERCAPGYLDRPWARAANEDANVCKACECNLHSNTCTFSQHLFLLSKKISGGVCEDCRHHTTGEKCHQCAEGYYRDWTKPVSHPRVCLKCQCHPIGSIGNRPCDRKTGQCHCKSGVTGQTCNRCLDGYKQTRSKITPCVKAVDALIFSGSATRSSSQSAAVKSPIRDEFCPPCEKNSKRFRFKKFCRRQAVFRGTVISQEVRGELVRLGVRVHDVWRNKGNAAHRHLPSHIRHNQALVIPVWVPYVKQQKAVHSACSCPRFNIGQSYLFISQAYDIPYHDGSELLLDQKSTILPWSESWRRRMTRFAVRQERGKCDDLTENVYSQARTNSAQHRNFLRHRSVIPSFSSQSPSSADAQPLTPRHFYQSDPNFFHVNPAPVAPSWSHNQYRSMRYADSSLQQPPLS